MFVKHYPSLSLRIALACVVLTQLFAAFPVNAASNTGIKISSGIGAIGSTVNKETGSRFSLLIATPTPVQYTLTLQPASAAGIDAYIYSGSKNSNYGTAIEMGIGEDINSSNKTARSLLKFDLASIPANATITAATLSLWISKDLSSNTRTVRVYRLKTSFQESQVTWNGPAAGVSWQTAGASGANDRESTAIGSVSLLNNEALYQEKQIVLQPVRIQEMVSGAFMNRGFLLAADTEQNDRFNYITSDSTDATRRPRLVVQYIVPPLIVSETPTDTPSPTISYTSSPTATPTFSPTPIQTLTSSATPAPSETPSATATWTLTPSATITPSSTPSATATRTFTPSATKPEVTPPTSTASPTNTSTAVWVVTETQTPVVPTLGPLAVSSANSRYFAKPDGTIVYLAGSHTWCDFMDCGDTNPPLPFDYAAYLNFLQANNHNFLRLWRAENARGGETGDNFWFSPMPYERSATECCAFDGGNKFDLTQFNQSYFDRLRQRTIDAGNRGIYVSIMLFDGWSIESKAASHNPWAGHPYKLSNNINSINGDLNNDNQGGETHTLSSSQITALQEAYVSKVIDSVNDLDNVLYELSNESTGSAANTAWQYYMINYIKSYEASKPRQHPVGMTIQYPNGSSTDLFNSPADWISPNGTLDTPPVANGSKVILADTDHLCGICGSRQWVWKSFTRGQNPLFMDPYHAMYYGRGAPLDYDPNNANDVSLRQNLGYTRSYAARINLAAMTPQPDLCSSGYCLAQIGVEYLAYLPSGRSISVDLRAASGSFKVEWFNPGNGTTFNNGLVNGGSTRTLDSPFTDDAVLYLKSYQNETPAPFTPSCTPDATETPAFTSTASPTFTLTLPATDTPRPTGTFTPTPTRTSTATSTSVPTPTATASGGFPITQLRDNFDRANGAIGTNWAGYTSAFRIAASQLDVTTTGMNTYILWQGASFGADQEAYVTLTQVDTGSNEQSLILKSQSSNGTSAGLIQVLYNGAGRTVQVWTYHPSLGWVQHGTGIAVTFVNGDQLGVRARPDGSVEVYKNGTLLGIRTITSWPYYAGGGYIGLWAANAPSALLDNFGGGTR